MAIKGQRSAGVLAAAVVAMLACSGCWPVRGASGSRWSYNSVEQAFTTDTVDEIEIDWVFDEARDGWQPNVTSAVVSRAGVVHLGAPTDEGYRVFGLDPATGAVRWSQRVDSRGFSPGDPQSPPWVEEDRVYFSTQVDHPTVVDTDHGTTQAFDTATGEDLGVVGDGGDIQAATDGFGALIVRDEASNQGVSTGTLYSGRFSADFSTQPFRPTPLYSGSTSGGDIRGGLTIGKGTMLHSGLGLASTTPGSTQQRTALRGYRITTPGDAQCGPLRTGGPRVECPAWVTGPLDIVDGSAPVVNTTGEQVYMGVNFEGVRAFDIDDGTELWRGTSGEWPVRTPALANGNLYVGTSTGVTVYDQDGCGTPTCDPLWASGPLPNGEGSPGQAEQQPAVAGDLVFVPVMADGQQPRLVAFDTDGCGQARCEPVWGIDLPGRVTAEIAISQGHIFVPTQEGLVALGT
jgi:outer membrane protein assembly factor BamB